MKKTFRIKIIAKNCKETFKEDLGEGVLGQLDLVFDLDERDYKSAMFVKTLLDEGDKLIDELIVQKIEEVDTKEKI